MDLMSAETRARIACRIYLKLFDAGDEGAIIAAGATHVPCHLMPEDPNQVRVVMEELREAEAIHAGNTAHPMLNVLLPVQRDRMERRMPEVGSYVDRLRADLATYDRGEQVHAGAFIKTEAAIRTGHSEVEPI